MPDYTVSDTTIGQLERVWLASRTDDTAHLQIHQCLSGFLERLNQGGASLDAIFTEIGGDLNPILSAHDVRQNFLKAQKTGILSVSVPLAIAEATELQQTLSSPLPTGSLRVIVGQVGRHNSTQSKARVDAVAEAAAGYFVNVVPQRPLASDRTPPYSSSCIGVSGGNTMFNVVQCIAQRKGGQYENVTVIPLAGEAEPDKFRISANSIALRLGDACVPGGAETCSLMTTPIVAPAAQVRDLQDQQLNSPPIEHVIEQARHVKFAFTGIGKTGSSEDALERLKRYCKIQGPTPKQVVGDICYRPINSQGEDAWPELSARLVGPTLDDLRHMSATPGTRRVFAVASGTAKVEPIIAAIRGGLVNGLITDQLTARDILQHLKGTP